MVTGPERRWRPDDDAVHELPPPMDLSQVECPGPITPPPAPAAATDDEREHPGLITYFTPDGPTPWLLARYPEYAAAYARARERRDRKLRRHRRRTAMAHTEPLPFRHRNRGWRPVR